MEFTLAKRTLKKLLKELDLHNLLFISQDVRLFSLDQASLSNLQVFDYETIRKLVVIAEEARKMIEE